LNLTNGLVSPQYHCHYDKFFETTCLNQADLEVPISWRDKPDLSSMMEEATLSSITTVFRRFMIPVKTRVLWKLLSMMGLMTQSSDMDAPGHGSHPFSCPSPYFSTTYHPGELVIILAFLFNLALHQIGFTLAYTQAPVETDLFMELPQGIESHHGDSKDYVLKLLANLYSKKQAGRVWNHYLVECLEKLGFTSFLLMNVPSIATMSSLFCMWMKRIGGLGIEDEGHPTDYIGVNICQLRDGNYELTQIALIDAIINDVGIGNAYSKPVPGKVTDPLHAFKDSPEFDLDFSYRSEVGKLNYLAQTTHAGIMYATHQIAKREHGEAIIFLVRYLIKTYDLGLKFKPDPSRGFECYCDTDFSGN
ncbi:hypothetical protein ACHAW6_001799, partial [Cyclotella cf. meneghiniana]